MEQSIAVLFFVSLMAKHTQMIYTFAKYIVEAVLSPTWLEILINISVSLQQLTFVSFRVIIYEDSLKIRKIKELQEKAISPYSPN